MLTNGVNKMDLLKHAYVVYRARHGKYCTTLEEFTFIVTRVGMMSIYREIRNHRVNADKIDQGVLEMVSFADNESFSGINGYKHLSMPFEVEKSIKLMKNSRYKF